MKKIALSLAALGLFSLAATAQTAAPAGPDQGVLA